MPAKTNFDYVKFINCHTPEQVYDHVRSWTSKLTEKEHVIRSVILDIHLSIEAVMKEILFLHMVELLSCYKGEEKKYEDRKTRLEKTIQKMTFSQVHRLLSPCFDSFESGELSEYLPAIDELRNKVAHRSGIEAQYMGRNPFSDPDSFAELFVHSCSIRQELGEFIEKKIDDPKEMKRRGWLHYAGKPIKSAK